MKLIIDIDEKDFNLIRDNIKSYSLADMLFGAVKDGIPYRERLQGDLANEVWKLHKKYNSHLITGALEFNNELYDLLVKYQEEGADND